MSRTPSRPRAYAPDPAAPARPCEIPGCAAAAAYRAPKSRDTLNEYWWFCLDHVRQYNASWDFYKGMSPGQIEVQLRHDAGWQRPTWPLGRLGGRAFDPDQLDEALDALGRRPAGGKRATSGGAGNGRAAGQPPAELRQPLDTLGLGWPTDIQTVKTRYKALAKQHHPDANGGDRMAEERLKLINLAYAALRARLVPEAKVA
jgi:hypothetical protein